MRLPNQDREGVPRGKSGNKKKTERATRQWVAPSSGRIVPTEAKPSELSGCIVGAGEGSVKEKSDPK
jgi:hypothetical protein